MLMNTVWKILMNKFNREWTQSNVKIFWVWKSSTRDLGTRNKWTFLRLWDLSTPTTALQADFFSDWNLLQNNTRSWVFAQQQYSFRFNTNELSTNKHVNKSEQQWLHNRVSAEGIIRTSLLFCSRHWDKGLKRSHQS